ncbi:MAG TPA: hypothetical protein VIL72_13935 [Beijerinckiaceae bacterium]
MTQSHLHSFVAAVVAGMIAVAGVHGPGPGAKQFPTIVATAVAGQ